MNMVYKAALRNMVGIQHKKIRRNVDDKFNDVHDRLSAAYYDSGTFIQGKLIIDFGELKKTDPVEAKKIFDELHGLIFLLRNVALNEENEKLAVGMKENLEGFTDLSKALNKIDELKIKGVELVV